MLVDLYRVVRQALRASVDSYSIKAIEKLYGFERTAEVGGGDGRSSRFEEWLETGDDALLADVERYNEEDCRSTVELHEWLLSIAAARHLPWRLPPDQRAPTEEAIERDAEREAAARPAARRRGRGRPAAAARATCSSTTAARRSPLVGVVPLAAARRRGARSATATRSAGSSSDGEPEPDDRVARLHVRVPGAGAQDRRDGASIPRPAKGYRVDVDDDARLVTLRRGVGRADEPLPRRAHPRPAAPRRVKREALVALRRAYADGDLRALSRARPRCSSAAAPDVRLDLRDPVDAALSSGAATSSCRGRPARARHGTARGWRSR